MALDDILRALDEKAQAAIKSMMAEAEQEARRKMSEAEGEAARTRRIRLKKVEDRMRSEATSIVYSVSLKAKKELIEAQEQAVERVFSIAGERLSGLRGEEGYPEVFEALLGECLDYIDGEVVFEVREDDRGLLEKSMAVRRLPYRVLDTPLEASGGLNASSAAGDVTVMNTFDARLERAREKLRLEISNTLFGEQG